MHSAKGHIVVDERWRLELAVAATCRAFAPRASECLAPAPSQRTAAQQGSGTCRAISYYSYRYL
ncbi:hypothetical protein [Arabiibacter massiliensis]|uniref:hypothetical protein n=1 Tax=Arabiibacter massiliensis TaxID=1870985 RepID=UPI0011798BF3|nr:hypothetical protein [Arabiibacter massiliensis]